MLEAAAAALQAGDMSRTLRASTWLYPLVNTGHVVGIALLFGAIVPLDLRLMGCWKALPLEHLRRAAVPVSVVGLGLAVSTGLLLFLTRPLDYVDEPLFGIKMALLGAAVFNALMLRRSPRWRQSGSEASVRIPGGWRVAALASVVLWLSVITMGRLIGYR